MAKLYNLARMTTATTGMGTITLGSAVSGYLTFALAGVVNGDIVDYAIKDGSNTEHGTGTYTSSGTTLTRSVTKSTNSNATINLSGTAEIFISPRAETLNDAGLFTAGTLADARLSNVITAGGPIGDGTHVAQVTYDAHGRLTTVTSAAITKGFLGRTFYTATNSAITPPTGATQAVIRMQAAGGGSGGASAGGSTSGPGGAGAYLEAYIATLSGNFNYALGAAGAGGSSAGGNGGNASASTLAMTGITTLSAPGGLGGGGTNGTGQGAASGTTASPTLNSATTDWGVKGAASCVLSTDCVAGASFLAPGASFNNALSAALLYGGGGPAKAGNGLTGAAGGAGCLIIDWYS